MKLRECACTVDMWPEVRVSLQSQGNAKMGAKMGTEWVYLAALSTEGNPRQGAALSLPQVVSWNVEVL